MALELGEVGDAGERHDGVRDKSFLERPLVDFAVTGDTGKDLVMGSFLVDPLDAPHRLGVLACQVLRLQIGFLSVLSDIIDTYTPVIQPSRQEVRMLGAEINRNHTMACPNDFLRIIGIF